MSRKAKTNAIFVGTDWDNMVVVRNNEGQSAPTIQKHLLSFASKFGYKSLVDELTSGNWTEIYSKATKVSEIGSRESSRGIKADPVGRRGLITRAIIVKQDRVFLYYLDGKYWHVIPKYTMRYTSAHEARPTESKPSVEEKPSKERNASAVRISHLVNIDNTDLTVAVISTLVRSDALPFIIDRDEQGNLVIESESGKFLVAA